MFYISADKCGPDTFHCLDGSCISIALVCDFHWDCEGGDDERFCGKLDDDIFSPVESELDLDLGYIENVLMDCDS